MENYIDLKILNEYINNKLVNIVKHNEYDLWILKYTYITHAYKLWDDITLMCRSLVIDKNGKIISRSFKKFMNIEELTESSIDMTLNFEIFEKLDGSLITLFYYDVENKWIITSSGSFNSNQTALASNLINDNIISKLDKDNTYNFELIHPENRIVVNYGDTKKLVLLGVINNITDNELSYDEIINKYSNIFEIVNKFDIKNINKLYDLKKFEEDNKEGFVVKFSNNFRVKVKFDEYVKLHKMITNISTTTIWENLKNNYDLNQLFQIIPDEMFNKVINEVNLLNNKFIVIENDIIKEFIKIFHINDIKNRKDFAYEAQKYKYTNILYLIYDKKSYNDDIWKIIKPDYKRIC